METAQHLQNDYTSIHFMCATSQPKQANEYKKKFFIGKLINNFTQLTTHKNLLTVTAEALVGCNLPRKKNKQNVI